MASSKMIFTILDTSPFGGQIIPSHKFPSTTVKITDNSIVPPTIDISSGATSVLCVFTSPKGRDGQLQTIPTGLAGFMAEYGMGEVKVYGQPLLNAYMSAASGAVTLHCLRVTDSVDGAYSALVVVAKYKIEGVGEDAVMTVKFDGVINEDVPLNKLDMLDSWYTPPTAPDADGFTEVKLFSLAYVGRGTWGQNVSFRLTSNTDADGENPFKNYYLNTNAADPKLPIEETFSVVFSDDAYYNSENSAIEGVINDPDNGSMLIQLQYNLDGFNEIIDAYATNFPDTDKEVFDVLFGVDKTTRQAYPGYVIDTIDGIDLSAFSGISLKGGSDGALDPAGDPADRAEMLNNLYVQAFSGLIDPMIKSKNKYPTSYMLDAAYSDEVKILMGTLSVTRGDCKVYFDAGYPATKQAALNYVSSSTVANFTNGWNQELDAYWGQVRDPYTNALNKATSTYALAILLPVRYRANGGKHVPIAGNVLGIIENYYVKGSIVPEFDEDIDADMMDQMVEFRANFARNNAFNQIIRATQTTRYPAVSALSEGNNASVVLDIKREAEKLCAYMEYDFSDPSSLAKYNSLLDGLVDKYSLAQVQSIKAKFSQNDWEARRSIMHLTIDIVNRKLIKQCIISINVNAE